MSAPNGAPITPPSTTILSAATFDELSQASYDAVTDGSDQFRYVATDDIKPLVKARRGTSEPEYIAFMRSQFMTDPCGGCSA